MGRWVDEERGVGNPSYDFDGGGIRCLAPLIKLSKCTLALACDFGVPLSRLRCQAPCSIYERARPKQVSASVSARKVKNRPGSRASSAWHLLKSSGFQVQYEVKGVMPVGLSDEQWEDLIRLLRMLPEEGIRAVQAFAEELARRETAVQEARAPYVAPAEVEEGKAHPDEPEPRAISPPATPEQALDLISSGPPGFLPGELDQLLADIEHIREMELDSPCQPT
jgi:hypothetical protein